MKALFIYNPYSGKNKIEKKLDYIMQRLNIKFSEIKVFKTIDKGNITQEIISYGSLYDVIIICGGDGTIHEAINAMMKLDYKPALGVIPTGTCNDFAKTLGISRYLDKAITNIINMNINTIDVSEFNDMYFNYGMALGTLTQISYTASLKGKRRVGVIAYYIEALKVFARIKPFKLSLEANDLKIEDIFNIALVLNTRYLAGFKLRLKDNYLNNNSLKIVLFKKTNKLMSIFDFGMFLLFGEKYKHNIIRLNTNQLKISSSLDSCNIDGEGVSNINVININVLNNAINVITNPKISEKSFLKYNKD